MNPSCRIYVKLLKKFEVASKTRTHVIDDENSAKQLSILTKAFSKPIAILRSFGNNPLYFKKITFGNTDITYRQFEYRTFSVLTIATFVLQIFFMGGLIFLGYRIFGGDYRTSEIQGARGETKSSSAIADSLMRTFISLSFLPFVGGAICSFLSTAKLSNYLNYWSDFTFEFSKTFPGEYLNWKNINSRSNIFFISSSIISVAYTSILIFLNQECLFNVLKNCSLLQREQGLMMVGFGCGSTLNTTFEYYKIRIMFETTSHALGQIKDAIHNSKSHMLQNKLFLRQLLTLIHGVRDQVKLSMDIFGSTILFTLIFIFGAAIISWMIALQFATGNIDVSYIIVVASVSFMFTARFATLIVFTERITTKERQVIDEISSLKLYRMKDQIDVQMFSNLVTKRPSAFTLGNIITMKRSLFLTLVSSSTTYLIAIMQLLNVSSTTENPASSTSTYDVLI